MGEIGLELGAEGEELTDTTLFGIATQGFGGDVIAVRPGKDAIGQEGFGEKGFIAQGLFERAAFGAVVAEIKLCDEAVAEPQ